MPEAVPFGFVGPSYTAISPVIDDELAMNCYVEKSESEGAATVKALLQTPGRKVFATLPEGAVPGGFTVNGRTFFAASNLWELDASGAQINRGSLGLAPTLVTRITANETQLVVSNNGDLFVLTLSTNAFVAVNMGQFNGLVLTIDFADGYIIAVLQNSHTFQVSALEDATTWSGLDIATLSYFPDNIVSMICDHRQIQFSSAKKSLWYYNGGAGFPVFIPIQGAFAEVGSGATFSITQADESVFWLSQDERGSLVAMVANGYNGQRVSTHAVEFAWQQFATSNDAISWTYQENGHTFWNILFPTANATWSYDISSQLWRSAATGSKITEPTSRTGPCATPSTSANIWWGIGHREIFTISARNTWTTRATRSGAGAERRRRAKRTSGFTSSRSNSCWARASRLRFRCSTETAIRARPS